MKNLITVTQTLSWLIVLSLNSQWVEAQELKPHQLEGGPEVGRLSREEILHKFDQDGDGQLSDEERQAAQEALASPKPGNQEEKRPKVDRPSREEILHKFDQDGDGQLNDEERQAAQKADSDQRPKQENPGQKKPDPQKPDPNQRPKDRKPQPDQRPQIQPSILYLKPIIKRQPDDRPQPLKDPVKKPVEEAAPDAEIDSVAADQEPTLEARDPAVDRGEVRPKWDPKPAEVLKPEAPREHEAEAGKKPGKIQQGQPVLQAPPVGKRFPIAVHLKAADRATALTFRLTYDPTALRLVKAERPDDVDQQEVDIKRLQPGWVQFRMRRLPPGPAPLAVVVFEVIEGKDSALGFYNVRLFGPAEAPLPVVTRGLTALKWQRGQPEPNEPEPSKPGGGQAGEIVAEMIGQIQVAEDGDHKFELLQAVKADTRLAISFTQVSFGAELTLDGTDIQISAKSEDGHLSSAPMDIDLKTGKYLLRARYYGKLHAPETPIGSLTIGFEEVVIDRPFEVKKAGQYQVQLNARLGKGWANCDGDLVGKIEIPEIPAEGVTIPLLSGQDLEAGTWIELHGEMGVVVSSRTRVQPSKPDGKEPPDKESAHVFLAPAKVALPPVGELVQFDVMVENAHQVSMFAFKLTFDPDVLGVDAIKLGNFLPEGAEELAFAAVFEPGVIPFGGQAKEGVAEKTEGNLAIVTLKVLSQVRSEIGFSLVALSDAGGQEMPVRGGVAEVVPSHPHTPPSPQETGQWAAPLWVESQDSELKKQELQFGVSNRASSGFDVDLDQLAPPTPNPPVKLYAYWQIEDELATQLLADYRSPSENLVYRLRIRADKHPFTLQWNVDSVPDHFTSLKLRSVEQKTEIDMRSTDQAEFPAMEGQFYLLELIASQRIKLHLYPGWNLISLPGTPEAELTPKSMADKSETAMAPLFRWLSAGYAYKEAEQLDLGEGYWFLTLNQAGEEMELPVTPTDRYSIGLKAGWNMIGSVNKISDFSDPQDLPDNSIVPNSLFEWQPQRYTYNQVHQIEPGKGYWVLSFADCQLTVGGNKMSTSPQRSRQPEILIPLVFTSGGLSQKLEIGYDTTATDRFESMDWPMPPSSPVDQDLQAYLVGDRYHLRRDIKTVSVGPASWRIQVSSKEPAQLTVDARAIPAEQELVISDGHSEAVFAAGVEMQLDNGDRELTVSLRPLPKVTQLLQNYPNPFNPETWIPYQLNQESEVSLSVYSSEGKLVRQIDLGLKPAGNYQRTERAIYWDGRNASGESVSSGVYFYRLQAGDYSQTRKMVILK